MKGGDKMVVLTGVMCLAACAGYKDKVSATQQQLAHLWTDKVTSIPVAEDSTIVSVCGHPRTVSHQDLPNSCSVADLQMIYNHYTGDHLSEEQIDSLYHSQHPFLSSTSRIFLQGQNPHVGSMARFLRNNISTIDVTVTKQTLTASLLKEICSQGGSIMISIHSSLGYPHRVIIVGYEQYEGIGHVQFINPSGVATSTQGTRILYRDDSRTLNSLDVSSEVLIQESTRLDFNLLHYYTLSSNVFPINQIHRTNYIMIMKK